MKRFSVHKWCTILFSAVLSATLSGPSLRAQHARFYNLGHYPGGTYAEPWGINRAGVIVGKGDIASGYTRPIGVPLYGPHAGHWFDLRTLGGERTDSYVMAMDIADTGMIVGHTAITGNEIIHAFVWTTDTGMLDIGTLADIGYAGHANSIVWGTNRFGTLLVGWSSIGLATDCPFDATADSLPVVWTPKTVWNSGHWEVKWQIHKLETIDNAGFTCWSAFYPNDRGQIVGLAVAPNGTTVGVVWNPIPGGKDWKIQQLPGTQEYPGVYPTYINNNGEIVGDVFSVDPLTGNWNANFPAHWKPTNRSGSEFSVTILPTLGGYLSGGGDGEGINDVGDIVGGSTDANGNYYATAWSTRDLDAVPRLLPSPRHSGSWSWASKVNNNGVVAGSYGNDDVLENTAAWTLR